MRVAVTSPSFSKHPVLIQKMNELFPEAKLNSLGDIFSKEELISYLKGYEAVIVGLDPIDKEVIDALPSLKIVSKYGVGLNNIDIEYCKSKNIAIGWTGGVNRLSVAEMCLGNMITLIRNITPSSRNLAEMQWIKNGGEQLTGKRIGIIGLGFIGKELIRLLQPFNCEIWVNDIVYDEEFVMKYNLQKKTKEEMYQNCRIISIHTPLTDATNKMISEKELSMMATGTILLNSARGGIVNELDLMKELKSNRLLAALDVFEIEPPEDSDFLKLKNLVATPHIGGNAKEAVEAMGLSAIEHLIEFSKKI
ncbi:MAG: phosphoglycerate dehydrogenase [Bacteroidetes bacterium]|nr:phosphoglycerate dehydrogenase [Bacteroidota bacterium]